MKTIVIVMLASLVSPALADVYRCNSGGKTIYQDAPCPNAKVIDNINGQAPLRQNQMQAMERAAAAQLSKSREDNSTRTTTTTLTLETAGPIPNAPKTNRPDRYYDRPDRFENRSITTHTTTNR